jgi:aldehyde dehydrogenase
MLLSSLRRSASLAPAARHARQLSNAMRAFAVVDLGLPTKYGHFINGEFVEPVEGQYFDNVSPVDGSTFIQAARGSKADIDRAVEAANVAYTSTWSKTSVTERSNMLLKVADIIEANAERLAKIETVDNGKAIRECNAADLPLVIDHFRYFAGVIRAEEGTASELDTNTVSLCIQEPLGVVGSIIPWNFPLLMAAWKLAPALAAGNCVVMKPAEQTPTSIMAMMELIKDVFPAGVVNVVTGFGAEAGEALATSKGIAKLGFTGSTATGTKILKAAADNMIPTTLELGGKSPSIFFKSVCDQDDEFLDKAVEGAVLFALNQGEVCTCHSRLLVQEDIYDQFVERIVARTEAIKMGDPLDASTMMGAQVSRAQFDRIVNYLDLGKSEGAKVLTGGVAKSDAVAGGFYIKPTIFAGTNNMRIFQEEIFGPVTGVIKFKTEEEAIAIANDTIYGLGAGVWTRDAHQAYQVPRAIQAGRVWVNCYHACAPLPTSTLIWQHVPPGLGPRAASRACSLSSRCTPAPLQAAASPAPAVAGWRVDPSRFRPADPTHPSNPSDPTDRCSDPVVADPAHAPFGGYKQSGFGRETHKMMLNHYRQASASVRVSSGVVMSLVLCRGPRTVRAEM